METTCTSTPCASMSFSRSSGVRRTFGEVKCVRLPPPTRRRRRRRVRDESRTNPSGVGGPATGIAARDERGCRWSHERAYFLKRLPNPRRCRRGVSSRARRRARPVTRSENQAHSLRAFLSAAARDGLRALEAPARVEVGALATGMDGGAAVRALLQRAVAIGRTAPHAHTGRRCACEHPAAPRSVGGAGGGGRRGSAPWSGNLAGGTFGRRHPVILPNPDSACELVIAAP